MKRNIKLLGLLFFIALGFNINAQILKPVKWKFSVKVVNENEVKLIANAAMDATWHLFGQFSEPAGGIPLEFVFDPSKNYKLKGKVGEWPKPHKEYDEIMEANVQYYEKTAVFTQIIQVLSENDFIVSGSLSGQTCTTVDGKCLQVNESFEFKVPGLKSIQKELNPTAVNDTSNVNKIDTNQVINPADTNQSKTDTLTGGSNNNTEINSVTEHKGLWALFIAAFLAGLLAILTPCVFPMIPMTVSFFLHDKKSKAKGRFEAGFFSLSIILIYTFIGTLVSVTLGPEFANALSTHWIPNVIFFLVFIIFAASFFGMFEIVLPNWIVRKSESQVDKGGWTAPFFMALSLVIVSFSCTGPIVASVLVEAAGGSFIVPIVGMLGFGLAFAIPFGLFAFFPNMLQRMPSSGGWLNSVKVVLGFIELALGLKFLSIADLTYHWGILDRHVYLALWIVIFTLMGLYLMGKIKFAHDSEVTHIKVPRLMLIIITFSFVVYMIPGMFGAPLKILSGYLPPMSTHEFDIAKVVRMNANSNELVGCTEPKYADKHEMPHGLNGYFDYEQALACAAAQNKPVLVDFTGYACVNCRKMEDNVWGESPVLPYLKNDYVIVSLFVDDKTELPKEDWVTSSYDGKVKKTLGSKYADFQITRFKMNAQPAYIIMDHKGEVLLKDPYFYDPDPHKFAKFLKDGIQKYKEKYK